MDVAARLRAAVALAGRFPALSGVDLTVAGGEVVAVEGSNGAGKTSLLRACAGLLPVHSGTIEILGHDLRADPAAVRRRVGVLGHAPGLYDELNATENVRFAVRAAGAGAELVEASLLRLGITGRLAKIEAGRLSAGQRRRVALAAVMARAPELWLLDEPHAGLDAATRRVVDGAIDEAVRGGATVIFTSHEQALAEDLADRVVTLSGGRVRDVRSGGRRAKLTAVPKGGTHVA
jgi:heme ABC exporter ATP-binding subunit CcmA